MHDKNEKKITDNTLQKRIYDYFLSKKTGSLCCVLPDSTIVDIPFIRGTPKLKYTKNNFNIPILSKKLKKAFSVHPRKLVFIDMPLSESEVYIDGFFIDVHQLILWGSFGSSFYLSEFINITPETQIVIVKDFTHLLPTEDLRIIHSNLALKKGQDTTWLFSEMKRTLVKNPYFSVRKDLDTFMATILYPLMLFGYIEIREGESTGKNRGILFRLRNALFRKKKLIQERRNV